MPTVSQSLDIPAGQLVVWEIATDFSRYGEWNITHSGFPDGPPPAAPGARFREQITIMGMPGEASWMVAELAPPDRLVWSGEGPMGIRLGTKLELAPIAETQGTLVSIEVSFDGGPLAGPIGETVATSARKGALQSLERLRALVV